MPNQDSKKAAAAGADARSAWGTYEPHFPKAARSYPVAGKSDHKVFCSSVSPYFPSVAKR